MVTQADLDDARGRIRTSRELLVAEPARRMAATLDRDAEGLRDGGALPPGWHWLYFLDAPPGALLGADGRSVAGGFYPETGLPRRMWAGGSLTFDGSLALGGEASSTTTISRVERKQGRSGALVFVSTEHRIVQGGHEAVVETRDLVFREAARPGENTRRAEPPGEAAWRREIAPDPVLLFRFSALTFNAHRIHYDADYCRQEEGYPGLVVHGPLLALLLLDLAGRQLAERRFRRFTYRGVAPVFAPGSFHVCGAPGDDGRIRLWAESADGALATTADLELA